MDGRQLKMCNFHFEVCIIVSKIVAHALIFNLNSNFCLSDDDVSSAEGHELWIIRAVIPFLRSSLFKCLVFMTEGTTSFIFESTAHSLHHEHHSLKTTPSNHKIILIIAHYSHCNSSSFLITPSCSGYQV